MKNNLIPFPTPYQRNEKRVEFLAQNEELKALRAAFDKARVDWPLEMAELPENNKIYCGSKR
jgi:hypothetical protein